LYRATGLAAQRGGIALDDEAGVTRLASQLDLHFEADRVWLDGADITEALRLESTGALASHISSLPAVRQALHALQLAFRRAPGLVADGRDMGTVVFPTAPLKVFLTASPESRADRRHKQLISKGIQTSIADLRVDIELRDLRDRTRSVAPLLPAEDALALDNSELSVDECVDLVLGWWRQRSLLG
jgi:3-phosphoshikimate 1-carboxyvinyltransferase